MTILEGQATLAAVQQAEAQLNRVILGKAPQVRLALTGLLAGGHLLIEDQPGVGKTTLATALARTLGLQYQRMQFTSDLLPGVLLGVSIFERATSTFSFQRGPIFTQVLLADELNRASPKTQSALLEAMAEHNVSIDGQTLPLPDPFFVIATQNPTAHLGTHPLPESQLDRFLMTLSLGYPDPSVERELLLGGNPARTLRDLPAVLTPGVVRTAQQAVASVHVTPVLVEYLQALVQATRSGGTFEVGLSSRAALGLLSAARAAAWLAGHPGVYPEDVQSVFPAVATHRLRDRRTGLPNPTAVQDLLHSTRIP